MSEDALQWQIEAIPGATGRLLKFQDAFCKKEIGTLQEIFDRGGAESSCPRFQDGL